MAFRRLLAGVAQGALRAVQQQAHTLPCTLAAAVSLTAPRAPAAAAAARLFSSSSLCSSCSSSLGLASLQQLAQRGSSVAAAGSRIACSAGVAAAAGAARAAGAAGWLRQQLRWRNDSSHLVPKFKGGKMKSYRCGEELAAVGCSPGVGCLSTCGAAPHFSRRGRSRYVGFFSLL